jgi:FkbM family methyltransferase
MPEIDFLQNYGLGRGAKVFDIGAHQGIVGMVIARLIEPGTVVCVEPVAHNVNSLNKNLLLNNIRDVVSIRAAVSNKGEMVEFV